MKKWELETLTKEQIKNLGADLPKKKNSVIVETAGFIPLEVKFKRFEQNGILNQLQSSDFTSNDYRQMYLHPDFDITPEDEIEEIEEKLKSLREYQKEYIEKLQKKKNNLEKIKVAEKPAESINSDSAENKE